MKISFVSIFTLLQFGLCWGLYFIRSRVSSWQAIATPPNPQRCVIFRQCIDPNSRSTINFSVQSLITCIAQCRNIGMPGCSVVHYSNVGKSCQLGVLTDVSRILHEDFFFGQEVHIQKGALRKCHNFEGDREQIAV